MNKSHCVFEQCSLHPKPPVVLCTLGKMPAICLMCTLCVTYIYIGNRTASLRWETLDIMKAAVLVLLLCLQVALQSHKGDAASLEKRVRFLSSLGSRLKWSARMAVYCRLSAKTTCLVLEIFCVISLFVCTGWGWGIGHRRRLRFPPTGDLVHSSCSLSYHSRCMLLCRCSQGRCSRSSV